MLVIAPKDNLARKFPSRDAVVIESSRGCAVTRFSFEDDLAGRSENIAPGRTDQVTKRRRETSLPLPRRRGNVRSAASNCDDDRSGSASGAGHRASVCAIWKFNAAPLNG